MRIIALFNLKPGIDAADFEDWAKARNLPVVRAQPSIEEFQLYRTTGLMRADGAPPYAYVQVIDVPDMEGYDKDAASEAMQAVQDEFGERAEAPVFMLTEALSLV
ncbi:REDY-like protein HapK [Polymorphobacter fuscus]|uniref:REDY-like protein HapK n=1 Tax=Sandarakinorhabdus fusca TaxID=1439888 RepID=A0A7C9GW83_9SPHN|nr:REDY-like protein HapK [Polymorphobacter fuscus]KAB7646541.1 REDY-like protein HapK [Polymorphobacter fuscus]MQT17789.1 REDY-like protein HapK [Polymorphobacter fuscus]NJC09663.1 hypothetical protein [Polymorphobacter fuscus]